MRYLQHFNSRLKKLRGRLGLELSDISRICNIDLGEVARWELTADGERSYPDLDQLLDLALKTGTPLTDLVDMDELALDPGQLDLPGFADVDDGGVGDALDNLQALVARVSLSRQEQELLRRFRDADSENQRLILQLMR